MRDEWFIRGEAPMTKSEVRAVVLSKFEFAGGDILLDIGAGTGSISVEAVLCHPVASVYAFEKKEKALGLLEENRRRAGAAGERIQIVPGSAPDSFPAAFERTPSHAFIGGSSGSLGKLFSRLLAINQEMRIVMTAISLETLAEALALIRERGIEAEIISVQIARGRTAGAYHLMEGGNPVYVISFGGPEGDSDFRRL